MGTNGSRKKLKTSAGEGLVKPLGLKKKKKSKEEYSEKNSKIVESEENLRKQKEEKKKNKSSEKRRSSRENKNTADDWHSNQSNTEVEAIGEKRKSKLKNKKRKMEKIIEPEIGEVDKPFNEMEHTHEEKEIEGGFDEQIGLEAREKKKKSKEKKRKNDKLKKAEINEVDEVYNDVEDGSSQRKGKSKKAHKMKRKGRILSKNDEEKGEAEQDEVYEISSGDEDCTAGMKKWITEYHQSRPGLNILQQRIDDFITAHEAQEEQARKEREARVAEDGWTVVVHHKGRKKTTDSESGVTVGSVAQAAVMDKLSKKKSKDVGIDFYRFQKREAQRNEVMMLQSKFEQDKKRIQQLRAARKFRPY